LKFNFCEFQTKNVEVKKKLNFEKKIFQLLYAQIVSPFHKPLLSAWDAKKGYIYIRGNSRNSPNKRSLQEISCHGENKYNPYVYSQPDEENKFENRL